jgi:hypothetical protein
MGISELAFGRVNAGAWTKIYSGPAVHPAPFFSLYFRTVPAGTLAYFVTYTWDIYSAIPPHYQRRTGLITTAFPSTDLAAPSDRLWGYTSTPWADILIFTSRTVDAKTW